MRPKTAGERNVGQPAEGSDLFTRTAVSVLQVATYAGPVMAVAM
jgi:hypothetical protein